MKPTETRTRTRTRVRTAGVPPQGDAARDGRGRVGGALRAAAGEIFCRDRWFALGVHRGIKGAEGQDTCSLSKRPLIVNSKILYYHFRGLLKFKAKLLTDFIKSQTKLPLRGN